MGMKKMLYVALPLALLFAGACSMIGLPDISPEERKVKSEIASWTREWESRNGNVYALSKSVLEDIRKLPEASRRTYYFNKFVDEVLSSSFEVGPKFPLEYWTTRPISIGADSEDDEPQRLLLGRHGAIVDIGEMLYYETWRHGWLLADQIVLVFRFAAKMEKERKRLGCLEVGCSGRLVDSLEERVCNFLKGPPSDEQQQVREVFEKMAGRPVRDREKILADLWTLNKKKDEAYHKMMKAYIQSSLEKKQSGKGERR